MGTIAVDQLDLPMTGGPGIFQSAEQQPAGSQAVRASLFQIEYTHGGHLTVP